MNFVDSLLVPRSLWAHMDEPIELVARVVVEYVHRRLNEPSLQVQDEIHLLGQFESRN
jgi:hypothetical protein